ncbi:DNA polymerase III subunit alpha [Clostridium botulinum]|uniref:PHP domain-containing protein n=1 Tax=Clostridium botulinum TaxID=1491 RepID=UPI00196825B8|nr:PHP domain-containing protein [Clostridium botulinum]MBN1074673.1 DNA polymerase III subunit alpha [Clostridium botulinum]
MKNSILTNEDFIHIHCHTDGGSNIRMKDSIVKVKDLIQYANKIGNKGVSITDHECLSSHVKAINTVKILKEDNILPQDFKLILGNEIYLVNLDSIKKLKEEKEKITFYHCVLLAKDEIGHYQLRQLSSRAWRDNYFNYRGLDRVPTGYSDIEEIIGNNKGHIICSTACLGGLLGNLSNELMYEKDIDKQNKIKEKMSDFIEWALDIFNEDFYLEMQPNTSEEQKFYNCLLVKISKAYNIPLIVTTDVHFINEEVREIHKAFLTSDDSDANREVDSFYETTRFFEVNEFYEYMDYLDRNIINEAILNTKTIANKITDYDLFNKTKIPLTPLPKKTEWYPIDLEIINKYKNIKELYNDSYEHHTYLIHKIFEGINYRKIPFIDMKETLERVDLECGELLGITKKLLEPMGAYLTTMQKNMEIIWGVSVVGCGRGSAVGWIINYLLDITQINPLKQQGMKLQHWRFLTAERPDFADIDIDYSSHLKNSVFKAIKNYYESIGGTAVRVATFRKETSKSAILTSCRGLRINSDIAQFISSLVKIERGFVWSISDMYYGNIKKNREPVTEFVNIIDKYKDRNLLKAMLTIEGLISGCSSHASGILCLNEPLENKSSFMRTPSGELITAYDLHEEESLGHIKFDFLLTNGISLLQLCIEMLVKDGFMKWQGTLKETYNKYLLPEYLDMNNKKLWDLICKGKLMNIFQFETPVGSIAIQKLQPKNLLDLANANSLMRLMNPNGEQPLDKYIKFRNNIELWEEEMKSYGLTKEERIIMHKQLDNQYGVCSNQESMMEMFMNPKISNFNIKEANLIRKAVAKKSEEALAEAKKLFYQKGAELKTSKQLMDYCWDVQTGYQKGYGFSLLHTDAYSTIAIQEGELFLKYPSIYWYTANLLSMSGSLESEDIEDDFFKSKEQTTNYGKTATAISRVQKEGVKVTPPYINEAEQGFKPNEKENVIVFGLKGITGINNETVKIINENKPFKNLKDFHDRMVTVKRPKLLKTGKTQMKSLVSSTQTITLIKAGAFDKIENKTREEILEDYLKILNPQKNKLNSKDISKISELGILPSEYKDIIRYYNFREFIMQLPKIKDKDSKSIEWLKIDCCEDTEYTTNFFLDSFSNEMTENIDYKYDEEGFLYVAIKTKRKGSFEYLYNEKIRPILEWLSTEDCISFYNSIRFNNIKNENMKGNISSWEMESMNYYYHEHELLQGNLSKYNIRNFNKLPIEPEIIGYTKYKNIQYPKYDLYNIAGTVLDRDKNKHLVTLLTIEGVVTVKFYSGQFSFYDKNISMDTGIDEKTGKNKKVTLEEGWFKRGNLLLVNGFRREGNFFPKRYKNSVVQHTVQLIKEIKPNGDLILQSERVNIDN